MSKHIFVTGGVVSSLGKGLTAASLALLLKKRGYRVKMQKLDPYLNVFTAQSNLLTSRQAVITLRVQALANSVQLIEALGGGWDANQLPSEQEVGSSGPVSLSGSSQAGGRQP